MFEAGQSDGDVKRQSLKNIPRNTFMGCTSLFVVVSFYPNGCSHELDRTVVQRYLQCVGMRQNPPFRFLLGQNILPESVMNLIEL